MSELKAIEKGKIRAELWKVKGTKQSVAVVKKGNKIVAVLPYDDVKDFTRLIKYMDELMIKDLVGD